jgi:hypothetical protein
MCYTCQLCNSTVPHNTPRITHILYRQRPEESKGGAKGTLEVEKEIPICHECREDITLGIPLIQTLRERREQRKQKKIAEALSKQHSVSKTRSKQVLGLLGTQLLPEYEGEQPDKKYPKSRSSTDKGTIKKPTNTPKPPKKDVVNKTPPPPKPSPNGKEDNSTDFAAGIF